MFQFSGFAYVLLKEGCPIRKFADQFLSADPRDLSQLVTSFIASETLDIPHTPLVTYLS